VYLLYFTASAESDGTLTLTDDPYGWDRALVAALDAL
jgi:murein L,D-transpeptidase YcbB/YkuD